MSQNKHSSSAESLEPTPEELEELANSANEALAEAMDHASQTAKSGEMRPSTMMAFDKMQEAHNILSESLPGWENPERDDDE